MTIKSFLITLVMGVFISFFLFKSCSKPVVTQPTITPPKNLVKNVVVAEKSTDIKVDSLQQLLQNAHKKVSKLTIEQRTADRKISLLRQRILSIGNQEPLTQNDYEAGKEELFAEIEKLNRANDQRDSLCDETVSTLQMSGVTKDSIIYLQDKLYDNLRLNFDTAINNNIKLLDFIKLQKKEIKKVKALGFVWKVAAVAAGVFIVKQSL